MSRGTKFNQTNFAECERDGNLLRAIEGMEGRRSNEGMSRTHTGNTFLLITSITTKLYWIPIGCQSTNGHGF